jgi:hypothetical protein
MDLVGIVDEAERAHELAELGPLASADGPLKATLGARDLESLRRAYQASLAGLEERLTRLPSTDPSRSYLQTLLVLTRKAELDLDNQIDQLTRLFRDLERMHDLVHELYPVDEG